MAASPMAATPYRVGKSPSETYSLKNRAVVRSKSKQYVKVTCSGKEYYLTLVEDSKIQSNELALHLLQREWMNVRLGDTIAVTPCDIPRTQYLIGTISLELDYHQKPKKPQAAVNTNDLATYFLELFNDNVFCNRQKFFIGMLKPILFNAVVLSMTAEEMGVESASSKKIQFGIIHPNTRIVFEKKPESVIQLIGRHMGDSAHQALISPNWDFNQMGIGGLDKEFSDIFRRAFASRVFPPDVVEQLGMKHVRGILLFGPPGTGKTLMARKIGEMLHAREPKIVNGPEILNKYVGESEANIRNLFADAEKEQAQLKFASALHIIIFDEIDAICRSRGSLSGSTGVHDTVVNQLLAKMDGVDQLNNILVIGMTNRKDMIDEALLRPGRLEVQMEINLPDEHGRLQILSIHTALLRKNKVLSPDINLEDLAKRTKNFSGAEIEGLVRSATSTAMNKLIKAGDKVMVTHEAAEKMKVELEDFEHALHHDLKPAFGSSEDQLNHFVYNGIIPWGQVQDILDRGKKAVKMAMDSQCAPLVSMLLTGLPDTGKTALAAYIAKDSGITFVKVLSPEDMVGFNESAKCGAIKKVFEDAYKSEISCIVIDDIERLLDYVPVGPRFSNLVLQALLVLLRKLPPISAGSKKVHRLLILGTTSMDGANLEEFGISKAFKSCVNIPCITKGSDILTIVEESKMFMFSSPELATLKTKLEKTKCKVGIKKLLDLIESAFQGRDRVESLVSLLEQEARLKDI